jgi:hypothetical protein
VFSTAIHWYEMDSQVHIWTCRYVSFSFKERFAFERHAFVQIRHSGLVNPSGINVHVPYCHTLLVIAVYYSDIKLTVNLSLCFNATP